MCGKEHTNCFSKNQSKRKKKKMARLLLLLVAVVLFSNAMPSVPYGEFLTEGVAFVRAPPCTIPFVQTFYEVSFKGETTEFTAYISAVQGWPGAVPSSSYKAICGFAKLSGHGTYVLESAGPTPTTSRTFNENHPNREGGFLADNLLLNLDDNPSSSSASLSSYGLLFKSSLRYDDLHPPMSPEGPAPGPGKTAGFELNIFYNLSSGRFSLIRYDAQRHHYDVNDSSPSLTVVRISALPHSSFCRPVTTLRKHMMDWKITGIRDDDHGAVLASGSVAAVSEVPGVPEGAFLAVAATLELSESVAQGGPTLYHLASLGPNQQYSPLFYATGNGFFFFNNLLFHLGPHLDGSGMVMVAQRNEWELNLYYQNETVSVCDGGPPLVCRNVSEGSGVVIWLYRRHDDTLLPRVFGKLHLKRRDTCAVEPPAVSMLQEKEGEKQVHQHNQGEREKGQETKKQRGSVWMWTTLAVVAGAVVVGGVFAGQQQPRAVEVKHLQPVAGKTPVQVTPTDVAI